MIEANPAAERWLPIAGFESYEVSDMGRVRSLPRVVQRGGHPYTIRGRILKPRFDDQGRQGVCLFHEGTKRQARIHLLVLEAFVGSRPPGMEGCHWDDDNSNNRLSNLRWDTRSSNEYDKVRNGGDHNARKTHCDNGHEFSPENTIWRNGKWRNCRTCQRKAVREAQRRVRARKAERGVCSHCAGPRDLSEFKICSACREKARESGARYRARRKERAA